ncbi:MULTISPECIES: tail fiber assembly protein [Enterobacterales]|uniref:tail fiber assembly protein n=1 Tax=Enterobacterales TaxID=91347 RepID=UPI000C13C97D|nr:MULTISPECIES: tail fiber assembly protein [Enterobacterales]EGC2433409.1 tail fiber assembly protein [Escherichia coli]HDT0787451.1 tail fiber assembly protein [Klebsiella aerogenes]MBA7875906.1 tail fiber assembly protein [Citrobacter sp. RHBSTW-00827]MBA7936996.1 tail fiber assembly protein [Citrobacter sp. RHBSTW-00509]MCL8178366.1 tail fiber assembly protein [Enterobacter cloacae]
MKYFTSDPVGLYDSEITSCIPAFAVEISDEKYLELIAGQEMGKRIMSDGSGLPVLMDEPEPTADESAAIIVAQQTYLRTVADNEIAWRQDAVDAGIATDEEMSDLTAWRRYRVLLMRIDTSDIQNIIWPEPPKK